MGIFGLKKQNTFDEEQPPQDPSRHGNTTELVPFYGIVNDLLVTNDGKFIMIFSMGSVQSVLGEGSVGFRQKAYAAALHSLPANTKFQMLIINEPSDPEKDINHFIQQGKYWAKQEKEYDGIDSRKYSQAMKLTDTAGAFAYTISQKYDELCPVYTKTYIVISWQIPMLAMSGNKKQVSVTDEIYLKHAEIAYDNLIEQAEILNAAFYNAGLPLRLLEAEEAAQVAWRSLHPTAQSEEELYAQTMAEDLANNRPIISQEPPQLNEFLKNPVGDDFRKLLAPDTVFIPKNYIDMDDVYCAIYSINDFTKGRVMNMESLTQLEGGFYASMFVHILPPETVIQDIKKHEVQSQAQQAIRQQMGRLEDFSTEDRFFGAKETRRKIETSQEHMINFHMFVMVSAKSTNVLQQRARSLESLFKTLDIKYALARHQHKNAFQNFLPTGFMAYPIPPRNMTPDATGQFITTEINNPSHQKGLYFGFDKLTKVPIRMRLFGENDELSPTLLIMGIPGSGKSVTLRTILISALLNGDNVLMIDIEGEMKEWCEAYGGRYIELGIHEGETINPLDIPFDDDPNVDILVTGVEHLVGFVGALKGEEIKPGPEWNALEHAYMRILTTKKWLDPETKRIDPKKWNREDAPRLSDIFDYLENSDLYRNESLDLAEILRPYAKTSYAKYFNHQTTFDISNEKLVVFGLSSLRNDSSGGRLRVSIWQVMTLIWSEVLRRHKSNPQIGNHVAMDELWKILEFPFGSKMIRDMTRRFRKYRASTIMATQYIMEFIHAKEGEEILSGRGSTFLMRQEESAAEIIGQVLRKPQYLMDYLPNLRNGEGILTNDTATYFTNLVLPEGIDVIIKKEKKQYI